MFFYVFVFLFMSCQTVNITELDPDQGIVRLRERHSNKEWDVLVQEIKEFKTRYPYTGFLQEALLMEADAYFQSNHYAEARTVYEEFIKRYPKNEQSAFCHFQTALTFDRQSPEAANRDQSYTVLATEQYGLFLERYPSHVLASQARERLQVLRLRMAQGQSHVARYYWRKNLPHSSLIRDLKIIKDYGQFAQLCQESLKRALSAYKVLQNRSKNHKETQEQIGFLERDFGSNLKDTMDHLQCPNE